MAIPITDVSWGSILTPHRIEKTGIRHGLLQDLALKILYLHGEMTLIQLGEYMCLSLGVIEEIFQYFRKEQLCEVKGMTGGTHRIAASQEGRERAASLLSLNQYAGPAPVSLKDYSARIKLQSVQNVRIGPKNIQPAFQDMVLDQDMILRLGHCFWHFDVPVRTHRYRKNQLGDAAASRLQRSGLDSTRSGSR